MYSSCFVCFTIFLPSFSCRKWRIDAPLLATHKTSPRRWILNKALTSHPKAASCLGLSQHSLICSAPVNGAHSSHVLLQFPPYLTHDGELAWTLLGGNDLQRGSDGLDANDRLVGVVCARHSQLQVATHQQLGRNVLQLQGGELWGEHVGQEQTITVESAELRKRKNNNHRA